MGIPPVSRFRYFQTIKLNESYQNIMRSLITIHSTLLLMLLLAILFLEGCDSNDSLSDEAYVPASEVLLYQSNEALRQHEFQFAIRLVDSAAAIAPQNPNVPFLKARIYSELGRWNTADSAYKETLGLKPDYRGVWNNLGNNAFRQQNFLAAVNYYRKELQENPASIPWRGLGRAYVELGKVDSARSAFQEAIRIDSSFTPAYLSLTFLLEDEGEYEAALSHISQALAITPENTEYRYMVGVLQFKTMDYESAVATLRPVVEKWPWHHGSHYNLGQALVRSGEKEAGKEFLDKAEEVRAAQAKIEHLESTVRSLPDNPMSHAALGFALRKAQRFNDAMHAYKVALYLDPQNPEIRNNIANLALIRGDTTLAMHHYQTIVKHDPSQVNTWLNIGIVYALTGHPEAARKSWETVLMYSPGHPAAKAYLAKLQRDTSNR